MAFDSVGLYGQQGFDLPPNETYRHQPSRMMSTIHDYSLDPDQYIGERSLSRAEDDDDDDELRGQPLVERIVTPDPFDQMEPVNRSKNAGLPFCEPYLGIVWSEIASTSSPKSSSASDVSPEVLALAPRPIPAIRDESTARFRLSAAASCDDLGMRRFGALPPPPPYYYPDVAPIYEPLVPQSPPGYHNQMRSETPPRAAFPNAIVTRSYDGNSDHDQRFGNEQFSPMPVPRTMHAPPQVPHHYASYPPQPNHFGSPGGHQGRNAADQQSGHLNQRRTADSRENSTVMLRNLPDSMSRNEFMSTLAREGFPPATYDFLYLPIDFRWHRNVGYAFVNLTTTLLARTFYTHFSGFTRWPKPASKPCSPGWSYPHQGLKANIDRYRNSPLRHKDVPDEYQPILFQNGFRLPFPPPTKNIKPPRQGTERMLV